MSDTVLVTKPEFAKAEGEFRGERRFRIEQKPDDEPSLGKAVREHRCRAVIVGVQPYGGPLYEALGEIGGAQGAIISRFGVGHDSIDKDQAREHRIVVTNTPGVLDQSVAEHTMWLIGTVARNVASCHAAMKAGDFTPRTGMELHDQTLAILGFGPIGRRVAAMAHFGFAMRVIAAGRVDAAELQRREGKSIEEIKREFGVEEYTNDVDWLFRQADVLSVHLPAVADTRHFVNADRLDMLKPDALLVNTARGSILDEDALYDALAAGRLAGAGLDVYQQEPYQPQSPDRDLRTLPSVVLTPHIGSNTRQANQAMARAALENVANFLAGNPDELTRVDRTNNR
jgi:lactate dehydrogenase-like 2-hydroxyacid dehydrogenase